MESWMQSWRPRTSESDARSYEGLHLSRKIISANLKIWCSKMQPLSGNQRPDLLTSLMNMSLVLRLPREMHLSRSSSSALRHNAVHFFDISTSKSAPTLVFCTFWLGNVLRATTTACTFSTYQLPKVVWDRQFFTLLNSKCASHHGGVQTFHLSSGEMAPRPPRAYFSTLWSHKSLEKHSVSRLSYLFTHLHLLSSDFLFSDLHFSALLFSDSSHRRFLRQSHIVTIIITHIAYIYNIYIYTVYTIYIYPCITIA